MYYFDFDRGLLTISLYVTYFIAYTLCDIIYMYTIKQVKKGIKRVIKVVFTYIILSIQAFI